MRLASEAVKLTEPTDALNQRAKILLDFSEILTLAGRNDDSVEKAQRALRLYELKGNIIGARNARAVLIETAIGEEHEEPHAGLFMTDS
jgi:hypothetical protein